MENNYALEKTEPVDCGNGDGTEGEEDPPDLGSAAGFAVDGDNHAAERDPNRQFDPDPGFAIAVTQSGDQTEARYEDEEEADAAGDGTHLFKAGAVASREGATEECAVAEEYHEDAEDV